jgi:acetolactate synthase-1/2/3 large subunit
MNGAVVPRDGATLLVEALESEGVTDVFGLPGLQLDPAVDALYHAQDRVRFRPVTHEQSATYMADGYARTAGRPGVAMVVPGPGMLNATAGLATAYACSSPVLAITGQIRSDLIGRGFGALHEIPDQSGILASLTKWSAIAGHPDEIPDLVHEAFRQMRSGVSRPVALEVPPDVLRAAASVSAGEPAAPDNPTLNDGPLADVLALLDRAERPLIVAGGGARAAGAGPALLEVAEALDCPVVVTRNGRGVVDGRHPLVLDPIAMREARASADLVIAVGSRLGSTDGGQADLGSGELVIVDLDPRMFLPPRRPTLSVRADALRFGERLRDALRARESRAARGWGARIAELRANATAALSVLEGQNAYLRAIRSALPDDGVFVSEYTQVGYVASVSYEVRQPGTFVSPGYQGSLGYGFATALGAQVGAGERSVVSVTGDGGFAWTLPELATAKRDRIPLVTLVFSDGYYSNVRRMQKEDSDGRYLATELTNPDFVALAGAYGVHAARADGPDRLQEELSTALARREPALIEVPVGEFPSPWGLIDAL